MTQHESHPIAVVGMSAIMPDAPSADAFWHNITAGKYSISPTPADRWDPALYYDEDHSVPDKTYSAIGGWVREFDWNPVAWRLPVPPVVAAQMDEGQRWAVSAARAALTDAGWPKWPVDNDRVAVILGNAPPRPASTSSRRHGAATSTTSSRSPRTPCPVSSRTSSPAGYRTCSTCVG